MKKLLFALVFVILAGMPLQTHAAMSWLEYSEMKCAKPDVAEEENAGTWSFTDGKWKYQNDDGTVPVNTWKVIDQKYYYFDESGACLTNTTAPDGFQVNESGECVKNGHVIFTPQRDYSKRVSSSVKAEKTLQSTGAITYLDMDTDKVKAQLKGWKSAERPALDTREFLFADGYPGVLFELTTSTTRDFCLHEEGAFAGFFQCSASDVITREEIEGALGVNCTVTSSPFLDNYFTLHFVYQGISVSVTGCMEDGTIRGNTCTMAMKELKFDERFYQ